MPEWLEARLRPVWQGWLVAGGLLVGLVGVLGASLEQAEWVRGAHSWLGLWLAVVGALALARSRFRGRTAFGYAGLMLLAGTAQHVGHLLPPLDAVPAEWVMQLHLRTVTLGERIAGWAAAAAQRQPVADTGLFVALLSLLAWGSSAWMGWWLIRRREALAATLPAGVLLAVNVHLSGQHWLLWCVYLALAAGLGIYLSYRRQHVDWDQRRVDYPEQLGLEWATASVLLAGGIGLAGVLGLLVGTPTTWRLLAELAARSQAEVGQTAGDLFSGVRPPQPGGTALAPQAVAWTPDLSRIGGPVDQSQATIMWVTLDERPPDDIPGAPLPPQHYWRAALYATYTGPGWQPINTRGAAPADLPAESPGRYALAQHYRIEAVHGQQLFAVSQPVSTTDAVAAPRLASAVEGDNTTLLAGPASQYSVVSLATRVSESELRSAPAEYPPAFHAAYLQLPDALPGRVRRLAEQITAGAPTPYDKALRLQAYLRATYTYRLDVAAPPEGQDAVDYFLFTASAGYCNYFASALAVMLRTVGVPARLATGYAMGEYDRGRGAYRVPGNAAHAWVEGYFPGYGWVEFEPTPSRQVWSRPAGAVEAVTAAAPAQPATARPGLASWLAGLFAVAVLAVGGWWLLGRADALSSDPRGQVLRLYRDERQWLALAGLDARPADTPDEFLQARSAALASRPVLLAALTRATELYSRAAYSLHPVRAGEAATARQMWSEARLSAVQLLVRQLIRGPKFKSR